MLLRYVTPTKGVRLDVFDGGLFVIKLGTKKLQIQHGILHVIFVGARKMASKLVPKVNIF